MIDTNHNGKIVFVLYPTPNSLKLPSVLYNKDGLVDVIYIKHIRNKAVAINVLLLLILVVIILRIYILYDIILNYLFK
jgi:hypothetical protein